MKDNKITIGDLAGMVQKGFNDVTTKMATKVEMEKGFKEVNKKLSKIENDLIKEHSEELRSLKERVRVLENALGIE